MSIRPDYYKDKAGHDIFWRMEHGEWPLEQCIGFCQINMAKYQERAGRKTADASVDLEKAETYQEELQRLLTIKAGGDDELERRSIAVKSD